MTRAYAGAIDRDLSLDTTNAEISTDCEQLNVVMIMFLWNDARLVVLMLEVLAI